MAKHAKRVHFAVGKAASEGVFREIRTGNTVTRVMSRRVYDAAIKRAGARIREYVRSAKARASA